MTAKGGAQAEVFLGTYYPKRGSPRRAFYVTVGDVIVSPPFKDRKLAERFADRVNRGTTGLMEHRPQVASGLPTDYTRVLASVLRAQGRALSAAVGGGRPHAHG
jgi:hypothetical protein